MDAMNLGCLGLGLGAITSLRFAIALGKWSTFYFVLSTLYFLLCTFYFVLSTLYFLLSTLYFVLCTNLNTLYALKYFVRFTSDFVRRYINLVRTLYANMTTLSLHCTHFDADVGDFVHFIRIYANFLRTKYKVIRLQGF